jgi:hypothetical protein
LTETCLVNNGNALFVIRLFLVGANARVLFELSAHFFDYFFSCDTHSLDCPSSENEHCHGPQQASNENLGDCNVDHLELLASHHLDLIEVS